MSRNSSLKVDPKTPVQGRISSSNTPHTSSTGWIIRFFPTFGFPRPERTRIAGVWIAPPPTATARARTVSLCPSAVVASTPFASPFSIRTFSTGALTTIRAPAS